MPAIQCFQARSQHTHGCTVPVLDLCHLGRVGSDADRLVARFTQAAQSGADANADLEHTARGRQGSPQALAGPLLSLPDRFVVTLEQAVVQVVEPSLPCLEHAGVHIERERKVGRTHGASICQWCGNDTTPCSAWSCTTSKRATCSAAAHRLIERSHNTYADTV